MYENIDTELLWAFGEAENKPHAKAWLVRWTSGVYTERVYKCAVCPDGVRSTRIEGGECKMTLRQISRINYKVIPFIVDIIHVPTGTSFRM